VVKLVPALAIFTVPVGVAQGLHFDATGPKRRATAGGRPLPFPVSTLCGSNEASIVRFARREQTLGGIVCRALGGRNDGGIASRTAGDADLAGAACLDLTGGCVGDAVFFRLGVTKRSTPATTAPATLVFTEVAHCPTPATGLACGF